MDNGRDIYSDVVSIQNHLIQLPPTEEKINKLHFRKQKYNFITQRGLLPIVSLFYSQLILHLSLYLGTS